MRERLRVIIAGGGTGGHVFPGIALADELVKSARAELLFIGTERGLESKVVPKKGYRIRYFPAEGVVGRSFVARARALYKLCVSVFEAGKLISSVRPHIVVGTGGYVSVGPVVAARLKRVPTLIMEQNVIPGVANRFLGKIADAVATTYQESLQFFPKAKIYFTGNPVRAEILSPGGDDPHELFGLEPGVFTVAVFGGSRGARSINNAVVNGLNYLTAVREKIQFLHQSGEHDYQGVREAYRKSGFRAMVAPFVHQMPEAYRVADLVVARAGATTLAELTALGKPAVLIPYPFAGEHQEFNARKLEELGAARMIRDGELSGERLAAEISRLMENGEERAQMAARSRAVGKPEAAERVAELVVSLARMGRR